MLSCLSLECSILFSEIVSPFRNVFNGVIINVTQIMSFFVVYQRIDNEDILCDMEDTKDEKWVCGTVEEFQQNRDICYDDNTNW